MPDHIHGIIVIDKMAVFRVAMVEARLIASLHQLMNSGGVTGIKNPHVARQFIPDHSIVQRAINLYMQKK